ncbi:NACHT domain-containing protein [Nonomuraea sp. M3C6]|uniref:NACHT domain-containing protein n=1 Tax=Nonomuraea marmarensis TaxID=3351344 RepID=A0ABW7AJJ1_9ACTN
MTDRRSSNSWKYLYERLGEKRFQQLCAALLKERSPEVTCYPVGQRDGGRDITHLGPERFLIYQVKWTSDRLQDPVPWLESAITGEAANIRRLVAAGAREYLLMTNVAGTSYPGRGTMDRLEEKLDNHSRTFGIAMRCEWQSDLDARVDAASREVKFAYGDMLAGYDLVRYLLECDRLEVREQELRNLLVKVIATQWEQDAKVKFKQVELDSHRLVDLFVDVEARQISAPRPIAPSGGSVAGQLSFDDDEGQIVGGAAQYLVDKQHPLTLIRGEPGQGKSTLGQFVCQLHRAAYLDRAPYVGDNGQFTIIDPRLPLRVDLKDYAAWLEGDSPYATSDTPPAARPRGAASSSLESFVAYLLYAHSGGLAVSVATVNEIFSRFPLLLVLDGLDEVAKSRIRRQTVVEIEAFAARLSVNRISPQLIVTTRPNASGLPEPSSELFRVLALVRLNPALRTAYLRKWADARGIYGAERRALQRTFDHRSAEPHIAQLAENPMHLTILLYLMYKRGESVPSKRTELYRSYMETFLDRETEKSRVVQTYRSELERVTAFLGWHMHSNAARGNTRMTAKEIKKTLNAHLYDIDADTSLVEQLFTGVTDRVWALASKVQGTFEFDVQPVQEYFAAKYLYEVANAPGGRSALLGYLLRRPFWWNTARFYAGFATINELPALLEELQEQQEAGQHPGQIRQAIWSLLADGVFTPRPRTQQRTARLLRDDLSIQLLIHALDTGGQLVALPADRGGADLVEVLWQDVATDPTRPLTAERMRLAHWLQPDRDAFGTWWLPYLDQALGTGNEMPWLEAAIPWNGGRLLSADHANRLVMDDAQAPATALAAGVQAIPDSPLEHRLVTAVLGGLCSHRVSEQVAGFAGDLLKALDPRNFLIMAARDRNAPLDAGRSRNPAHLSQTQITAAWRRLIARDPRFERVREARRFLKGQKDTTSPWGNTARELAGIVGPCWLAAEIAIIGAAASRQRWMTGGDISSGSQPFGAAPDYGRLLQNLRAAHTDPEWWREQLRTHPDPLSRGAWALALVSVADGAVVRECLADLDATVGVLPRALSTALMLSSSRLGAAYFARRLSGQILADTVALSAQTSLLIAHHEDLSATRWPPCQPLTTSRLIEMVSYGAAAWPAHYALTARMVHDATSEHLDGLSTLGPTDLHIGDLSSLSLQLPDLVATPIPLGHIKIILEDPGHYPRSWVNAADLQLSRRDQAPHLGQTAESEGWFSLD